MMKNILLILTLCVFSLVGFAAEKAQPITFTAGKEYQILDPTAENKAQPNNKILVQEFFSYGCHACYNMESTLQTWLKGKGDKIEFDRVPVVFEESWSVYARAYYAAKALGIDTKITPDLFSAVQDRKEDLSNKEIMAKLFNKYGITHETFTNTYDLSPGIGIQLKNADNLMVAYKVYEIPTIVIAGKYKTNGMMVNGDAKKFIQLINYLVDLELKQKK